MLSSKTLKLVVAVTLILATLVSASCQLRPAPKVTLTPFVTPTPTLPPGTKEPVTSGTIAETLAARGRVTAARQSLLFFTIAGWLKTIDFAARDQVEAKQPLAELEVTGLDDNLSDAQFNLDNARLRLEQARQAQVQIGDLQVQQANAWVEYYNAQAQHATADIDKKLYEIQARIAGLDVAINKAKQDSAKFDLQALSREVEYRQALVKRAEDKLAQTKLAAPFNGLILSLEVIPGTWVQPYQAIGAIADPSQLQVEASIDAADIGRVALAQPATVTLDAYPNSQFTGTVKQIASKATIWQGKQVYNVIVGFDEGQTVPATIRMGADVDLKTRIRANVLTVPSSAIFIDGGHKYVEVIEGNKVNRLEVETGISSGTRTEILAGLREGQTVRVP